MLLNRPCETCGTPNSRPIGAAREVAPKSNGTGSLTFTAQCDGDVAGLEALFPREHSDNHELVYRWEADNQVVLERVQTAKALTPAGPKAITQAALEALSAEDLETKAAELGVAVVAKQSKAALAARVLEAIQKKSQ